MSQCGRAVARLAPRPAQLSSTLTIEGVVTPHGRREFFIAGEPTEQMSDAGELATAGELALSTRAAAALLTALGCSSVDPPVPASSSGPLLPFRSRTSKEDDGAARSSIKGWPSADLPARSSAVGKGPWLDDGAAQQQRTEETSRRSHRATFWRREDPMDAAMAQLDSKLKKGRWGETEEQRGFYIVTALGMDHGSWWNSLFAASSDDTPHARRGSWLGETLSAFQTPIPSLPKRLTRSLPLPVPSFSSPAPGGFDFAAVAAETLKVSKKGLDHTPTQASILRARSISIVRQPSLKRAEGIGSFMGRGLAVSLASQHMRDALKCFVPALVEEGIEAGTTNEWLSASRKLVTVFAKITGLGARLCDVVSLASLHRAVLIVQQATSRYGGQVTRLICDDKGVRFLIGFGMPGKSYEDDESRAVAASLQMQTLLQEVPNYDQSGGLAPAIGITTGNVFCGEAGSILRREYTLAGAQVNLAARLMQYASKQRPDGSRKAGAVVVSAEIKRQTENALERTPGISRLCTFITLDPIYVKGKAEAVSVFQARGSRLARGHVMEEGAMHRRGIADGTTPPPRQPRLTAKFGEDATLDDPSPTSAPAARRTKPLAPRKKPLLVGRDAELTKMKANFDKAIQGGPASGGRADARRVAERSIFADRTSDAVSTRRVDGSMGVDAARADASMPMRAQPVDPTPPLFIVGQTGMGKSELLNTFIEQHVVPTTPFAIKVEAVAVEATTPFYVWREIFQRLLSPEVVMELQALSDAEGGEASKLPGEASKSRAPEPTRPTPIQAGSPESATVAAAPYARSTTVGASFRECGESGTASAPASPSPKGKPNRTEELLGVLARATEKGEFDDEATDLEECSAVSMPVTGLSAPKQAVTFKDVTAPERTLASSAGAGGATGWQKLRQSRTKMSAIGVFGRSSSMRNLGARGAGSSLELASVSATVANTTAEAPAAARPIGGRFAAAMGRGRAVGGAATTAASAAEMIDQGRPPMLGEGRSSSSRGSDLSDAGSTRRFSMWRDAILSVLALREYDRGSGCIRPNRDRELLMDPTVRRLAPLLSPVLGTFSISDNKHTRRMANRVREVNQLLVMLKVLEIKLCGVKGVLAFEDCQWMDNSSWRLAREAMAVFTGHILVIVATRSPPNGTKRIPRGLQDGIEAKTTADSDILYGQATKLGMALHLEGLVDDDLKQMIAARLDVPAEQIPPGLTDLIGRAQGNPLHVIELLKLLESKEVIRVMTEKAAILLGQTPATFLAATGGAAVDGERSACLQHAHSVGEMPHVPQTLVPHRSATSPPRTTGKETRRFSSSDVPLGHHHSVDSQPRRASLPGPNLPVPSLPGPFPARTGNVLLFEPNLPSLTESTEEGKELVPESLNKIITERIDTIPPNLRLLLKVCAVVCHGEFDLQMVIAVYPVTLFTADAMRMIEQLEALEFIVAAQSRLHHAWGTLSFVPGQGANGGKPDRYRFVSTLVQEVVYKVLPQTQRRDLHRKAADKVSEYVRSMSLSSPNRRNAKMLPHLAQLAHHYSHSGEAKPALKYLSMAGAAALEQNSPIEALSFFEAALNTVERQKSQSESTRSNTGSTRSNPSRSGSSTSTAYGVHHGRGQGARGQMSLALLDRVHSHLLYQSAFCWYSVGELDECSNRLRLALQIAGFEHQHFLDASKTANILLAWACFRMGIMNILRRRRPQQPSPEALEEAVDIILLSPLSESDIATTHLSAYRRQRLRAAAMYDQLAVALEALGNMDRRYALYCSLRGTSLSLEAPFLTPTLARCFATLALIHTAHSVSATGVGHACWRLDRILGRHYSRLARQAFASGALAERSQSDVAWGRMTEGLVLADAGMWDQAADVLNIAAQHMHKLQAVRLWEECKVHLAFVYLFRGQLEQAERAFGHVVESTEARGDSNMRRWCDSGLAFIMLLKGSLVEASDYLEHSNAHGFAALAFMRHGRADFALASAYAAFHPQQGSRLRHKALEGRKMFAATWAMLQLLQAALRSASVTERRRVLSAPHMLFSKMGDFVTGKGTSRYRDSRLSVQGTTSSLSGRTMPLPAAGGRSVSARSSMRIETSTRTRAPSASGGDAAEASNSPPSGLGVSTPRKRFIMSRVSSGSAGGSGNSERARALGHGPSFAEMSSRGSYGSGEQVVYSTREARTSRAVSSTTLTRAATKMNILTEGVIRKVERSGTRAGSALARSVFGDDFEPDGESIDWIKMLDDLPQLHSWASDAVNRLEKLARANRTAGLCASLCRAAFTGMSADDTGRGQHYSELAAAQLQEVYLKARDRKMPFECGLAAECLAVYSSMPSIRRNALAQAKKCFADIGASYHEETVLKLQLAFDRQSSIRRPNKLERTLETPQQRGFGQRPSSLPKGARSNVRLSPPFGISRKTSSPSLGRPSRTRRLFMKTWQATAFRPKDVDLCSLELVRTGVLASPRDDRETGDVSILRQPRFSNTPRKSAPHEEAHEVSRPSPAHTPIALAPSPRWDGRAIASGLGSNSVARATLSGSVSTVSSRDTANAHSDSNVDEQPPQALGLSTIESCADLEVSASSALSNSSSSKARGAINGGAAALQRSSASSDSAVPAQLRALSEGEAGGEGAVIDDEGEERGSHAGENGGLALEMSAVPSDVLSPPLETRAHDGSRDAGMLLELSSQTEQSERDCEGGAAVSTPTPLWESPTSEQAPRLSSADI